MKRKASLLLFRDRFARGTGRLSDLPALAEARDRVCRVHEAIVAFCAALFATRLLFGVAGGVTCAQAGPGEAP